MIIKFIYCNWVVARWQWLCYMYTKHDLRYFLSIICLKLLLYVFNPLNTELNPICQ